MSQTISSIETTIAHALGVQVRQITAAIRLLDEGATIPFIARYRKEATHGLTDTQLRFLGERLDYLRELEERRQAILNALIEQAQLTPELKQAIERAETKTRLEDLYLPYRPKRRTKAWVAKEAGLGPLAAAILSDDELVPDEAAQAYLNQEAGIETPAAALEGARQILMEQFAEDPDFLEQERAYFWQHATLHSKMIKSDKKNSNAHKFNDYFNYSEALKTIPSHRALALFRGRRENVLQLSLVLPNEPDHGERAIVTYFKLDLAPQRPATPWLLETVRLAWKAKLLVKLESELFSRLRELADDEAIRVFVSNLRDLLLAAPAGPQVTMGLDPGIRTGVKVVVVDETGKLCDYATVFPFAPQSEWHEAIATLAKLATKYHVQLISIGNGTGSRETERLVSDLMKMYPDLSMTKMIVSEAGASVYSASALAADEFPDLDVSLRGAVSIARRLQDPLAELVKIEPKSIGVGQYQHDVNQSRLARSLEGVVEDCVNAVGVDINSASVALLTRVSGLNETLAKNLVAYRDEQGAFRNRMQLKHVPRMGEKAFQQSAGFLRISGGDQPLDASGVHPEAYPLVEKLLADHGVTIQQILGQTNLLRGIDASRYVDETWGLPTIRDILAELEKPGRDPRPEFKTVRFKEGVEDIRDLTLGMVLEGVVSNVTHFGAFVDIGVHQDGLVHISAMTQRFIRDPHDVVKAGDIVQVKVVEVDQVRRRIGLSMRLNDAKDHPQSSKNQVKKPTVVKKTPVVSTATQLKSNPFNTSMADAFSKLKRVSES